MKCAKAANRALGFFIVLIWLTGLAVTSAVAGNTSATMCGKLFRQKKYKEAFPYCRQAAEQGLADAQLNLGLMYAVGQGMVQSGAVAADWFYKAGLSYLKNGKEDDALRCVEAIKRLPKLGLSVPNLFLADKLLAAISYMVPTLLRKIMILCLSVCGKRGNCLQPCLWPKNLSEWAPGYSRLVIQTPL